MCNLIYEAMQHSITAKICIILMKEKALNSSNLAKAIQVKANTLVTQVLKCNSLLIMNFNIP